MRKPILFILLAIFVSMGAKCRADGDRVFTIAMDGKFSTLDPIGAVTVDANSERIRTLIYNSLVKKNETFEYVGDLAKTITPSEDGLSYSFELQEGVKFQNGELLTSADIKYTFDTLFESDSGKAAAFYETIDGKRSPIISGVETPDEKTVVIKIARPDLKNVFLPNLVPIAIIPNGSKVGNKSGAATNPPPGTGAYKFKSFDTAQNIVELEAFDEAWEGAPNIKQIRVKILSDANALQAELLSGAVDLAPAASNLTPDTLKSLNENPQLKVETFEGSNIQYLWFNTETKPFDNAAIRRAVAYAVDREKIIRDLLDGQAKPAHSILPEGSWAYTAGTKYDFNVEKSKMLLDEAGFKDSDGDGLREMATVIFKISSGNKATKEYAQVVQSQLKAIGIPVEIESLEFLTMLEQVKLGQFQMTTGRWVGGNQDPIFLGDLFHSSRIPTKDNKNDRNRGRYTNKRVDELVDSGMKELDSAKAKAYYVEAQEIISEELPLFPLWYPKNLVVASSRVGNIKMNASGDWDFVRNMTIDE